ncbi:2-methylisocitrate lyase-like PEP mutase family enzyme [Pseudomonas sp. PvP100]|nr:2-methylisocitrate lyase-like PEP mutase family enzyme [Pseudomonas sp. PvP007]MBP1195894.1 2-methylisocitrate lyase-like PEP mutase family enzyme [Pseudomonas sp. PvP100]
MKSLDNIFHELHNHGLLILANVSDAGGAKVVESLGATAIATSSAGMAWAHGYADGNQLPLTRLAASVESMTRILRVPLTVDIEAGYSDDLQHVASVVEAVIAAGAVGINIEDGTAPPEVLVRKIEVAREVADKHGINVSAPQTPSNQRRRCV